MGHWWESDDFLDSVAARVGGSVDRAALRDTARAAAERIELLAGRRFGESQAQTATIDAGGLPFVDVDDLQIGTQSADVDVWPVSDLANPALAQVLQVRALQTTAPKAAPDHRALLMAGRVVAEVHRQKRLSRDFVIEQLEPLFRPDFDEQQRLGFLRRLADPTVRIHLPIAISEANGWWIQISRRLLVATTRHGRDSRHLVERVFDDLPLVAAEPVVIVARMTTHPVERAYAVRIWAMNGEEPPAAWRIIARAVHRYGVPILTVDDASTPEEISCQLLLLAHWHGYLARDEPDLGEAVASAYPRPVQRIKRATGVPDERSAAALLLERLLHPGFDPIRGAHSVRKYVSRMARITVVEHRKANHAGAHAWDLLGVSERRYYKLLRRFAHREVGRWQVDDDVRKGIDNYLRMRDKHAAALDLLRGRGFNEAAARKWLQRHPVEAARQARPRTYRRPPPSSDASRPRGGGSGVANVRR